MEILSDPVKMSMMLKKANDVLTNFQSNKKEIVEGGGVGLIKDKE